METPQIPDTAVPVWEQCGLDQATFLAMPLAWRLEQGHRFAPPPARHRPVTRSLTPEELAALNEQAARERWSKAEYTERARVLQQTPAPA